MVASIGKALGPGAPPVRIYDESFRWSCRPSLAHFPVSDLSGQRLTSHSPAGIACQMSVKQPSTHFEGALAIDQVFVDLERYRAMVYAAPRLGTGAMTERLENFFELAQAVFKEFSNVEGFVFFGSALRGKMHPKDYDFMALLSYEGPETEKGGGIVWRAGIADEVSTKTPSSISLCSRFGSSRALNAPLSRLCGPAGDETALRAAGMAGEFRPAAAHPSYFFFSHDHYGRMSWLLGRGPALIALRPQGSTLPTFYSRLSENYLRDGMV